MIEDYQSRRRRTRLVARALFGAGVLLAGLAALAAYAFVLQARPIEETGASVVVAARDIPARTVIAAADVRATRVDPATVPAGAFRDPTAVIGRATASAVAAREIVLPSRLATTTTGIGVFPTGEQPSGSAPDYRAMSLSVPDQSAVGGTVQPGDIIDVIFAFAYEPVVVGAGPGPNVDYGARIVADRVAVLARSGPIYTLRVDAVQAERIAALIAGGATLHLLLRSGDDTRVPRASGAIFTREAGVIIRAIPPR